MKYLLPLLLISSNMALAEEVACKTRLGAEQAKALIGEVETGYEAVKTLQAEFAQLSYFLALDRSEVSRGKLRYKRPGMMRWSYLEPDIQEFVVGQNLVWFYQPDLKQVTIDRFTPAFHADIPVSFLLGLEGLREAYDVEEVCDLEGQLAVSLVPRREGVNVERLQLLVRTSDKLPVAARIYDLTGNITTVEFSKIELNREVSADAFSFSVPRGVDVIDRRRSPAFGFESPVIESEILNSNKEGR